MPLKRRAIPIKKPSILDTKAPKKTILSSPDVIYTEIKNMHGHLNQIKYGTSIFFYAELSLSK